MTNEEKRIAIAKACPGWQVHHGGRYCSISNCERPDLRGRLFDPLESESAMQEAEKTLSDSETLTYAVILEGIVQEWMVAQDDVKGWLKYWTVCATAAQRADAFLKVKGIL